VIEHADAAGSYRSHGKLLPAGHAELADQKEIERQPELARYLVGNRNAAARQSQNDAVPPPGIRTQLLGQPDAGLVAVLELWLIHGLVILLPSKRPHRSTCRE
jgi:hypothetical protein